MTSGNLLEYNKEVDDGGKGGRDREQRDSTMENAEFKARIIAIITQYEQGQISWQNKDDKIINETLCFCIAIQDKLNASMAEVPHDHAK